MNFIDDILAEIFAALTNTFSYITIYRSCDESSMNDIRSCLRFSGNNPLWMLKLRLVSKKFKYVFDSTFNTGGIYYNLVSSKLLIMNYELSLDSIFVLYLRKICVINFYQLFNRNQNINFKNYYTFNFKITTSDINVQNLEITCSEIDTPVLRVVHKNNKLQIYYSGENVYYNNLEDMKTMKNSTMPPNLKENNFRNTMIESQRSLKIFKSKFKKYDRNLKLVVDAAEIIMKKAAGSAALKS